MSDWDEVFVTSALLVFMEYGASIGEYHKEIDYQDEPAILSSYMSVKNSIAQTDFISSEQILAKAELDLKALSFSL